jgi:phosphatidylserine/phosphatidylglycerophosphate/cardiolipin synthase-like enzyme
LWLYFGWITDLEILDNGARQFAGLQPDWPSTKIRLSAVLEALLRKGADIVVIVREHPHNEAIARTVRALGQRYNGRARVIVAPDFHEKGMLGDDFVLSGSMNLTHNGVTVNDEHIVLRRDLESVEERRVVLEAKWGGGLL